MSFFDFNSADKGSTFDPIPTGTAARVHMQIKPGGVGPEGMVTQSGNTEAQYLECVFTIMLGQYAKRKIFQNIMVANVSDKCLNLSRSTFRQMLESARNIKPDDVSKQAAKAREVTSFNDFQDLEFAVKIGLEKDKTGMYGDKNKISFIITPEHKDYQAIMAGNNTEAPGAAASAPPPAWGADNNTSAPAQNHHSPAVPAWAQ